MSGALDGYIFAWRERERRERAAAECRAATARTLLPEACAELRRRGASRIRLFGSLTRGALGKGSDVDLCVEGLSAEGALEASEALCTLFGRRVDVVRWEAAPDHWREAIGQWGEELA